MYNTCIQKFPNARIRVHTSDCTNILSYVHANTHIQTVKKRLNEMNVSIALFCTCEYASQHCEYPLCRDEDSGRGVMVEGDETEWSQSACDHHIDADMV